MGNIKEDKKRNKLKYAIEHGNKGFIGVGING